jgi:hypothetical protein
METAIKKMREEENHQHRESVIQQRKIELEKVQNELEARLKTQELKEMLKRLK